MPAKPPTRATQRDRPCHTRRVGPLLKPLEGSRAPTVVSGYRAGASPAPTVVSGYRAGASPAPTVVSGYRAGASPAPAVNQDEVRCEVQTGKTDKRTD